MSFNPGDMQTMTKFVNLISPKTSHLRKNNNRDEQTTMQCPVLLNLNFNR